MHRVIEYNKILSSEIVSNSTNSEMGTTTIYHEERISVEEIKEEIILYIKEHGKISLSEALDKFNAPLYQIIQAIKELGSEGFLRGR